MTVLEATQKLIEYFNKNDSFIYPDNIKELFLTDSDPEIRDRIVEITLKQLDGGGIILTGDLKNKKTLYVLKCPLAAIKQGVELSGDVASLISSTINQFAENLKQPEMVCNPLNISEKDIKSLIIINSFLITKLNEKEVKE